MSNAIEVTAIRSGGWWAIEFATGAGIRYTQARRLDQVESMVRDICNVDGVPVDDIHISPVVRPPKRPSPRTRMPPGPPRRPGRRMPRRPVVRRRSFAVRD